MVAEWKGGGETKESVQEKWCLEQKILEKRKETLDEAKTKEVKKVKKGVLHLNITVINEMIYNILITASTSRA